MVEEPTRSHERKTLHGKMEVFLCSQLLFQLPPMRIAL